MADNYWTRHAARMRRRTLLGSAGAGGLGLAGLALAGCGDDDEPAPQPTAPSGGTTPASSGSPAASPAAASPTPVDLTRLSEADLFRALTDNPTKDWKDEDIKTGGTFVRISNRPAPTFDPMATVTGGTSDVTTPVYNSLLRLPNGQGQADIYATTIEGNLATAWEQPDNRTLILTLAPNIKWQNVAPLNGRAFTVEDIKYSFERGLTHAKSVHKANYTNIEKVEDAGGGKVRITLKRPNAATPLTLASWTSLIVPKELGDTQDINTKAVGTGAFIIDKYTPNVELVYKKNPEYFKKDKQGRALPYIDGYTISYVTDPATIRAVFEGGRADFWYATATPLPQSFTGLKDFVGRNPKVVYQKTQGVYGSFSYVPHHQQPPFNDVRVRRALSVSFDRKTIIDTLLKGQGSALNYFHWPSAIAKAPTLEDMGPWYKYDPAQAKQLLSAAGFPNGLTVDIAWQYEHEDLLLLFKQYAEASGIRINLNKSPDVATHVNTYIQRNWKDLILIGRGFNYPDVNEFMGYYTPKTSPTNYGGSDDPDLNALFNRQVELTGTERRTVHKQIWDRLLDQMYEVTSPSSHGLNFWQPTLKNWVVMTWPSNAGTGSGQMDSVWRGA